MAPLLENPAPRRAVLLIDHGSRSHQANEWLAELAERLEHHLEHEALLHTEASSHPQKDANQQATKRSTEKNGQKTESPALDPKGRATKWPFRAANEASPREAGSHGERARRAGSVSIVGFAHMELATPSVSEGVTECVRRGATEIVAIPCMLSRGRHVEEDIPRLLVAATQAHEGVQLQLAPPLSELPGFIEFLAQVVR